MLVNWARLLGLRSTYALPLLLVALLMLLFGLVGSVTMNWKTLFAVPMTVLLLSFMMGVQNATLTKMSNATIRTTHMTGVVTDLGIELGKMLFWNRLAGVQQQKVRANWSKVRLFGGCWPCFCGRHCRGAGLQAMGLCLRGAAGLVADAGFPAATVGRWPQAAALLCLPCNLKR